MEFSRQIKRQVARQQKARMSKAVRKKKKFMDAVQQRRGSYQAMKDHWLKTVEHLVPMWMQIVSLFIPPKWYLKFFEQVIVQLVVGRKVRTTRIVRGCFILPFMAAKKWIRYFGVTTKLEQVEKGKWIQEIRHWGRMVDRTEWDVR